MIKISKETIMTFYKQRMDFEKELQKLAKKTLIEKYNNISFLKSWSKQKIIEKIIEIELPKKMKGDNQNE